MRFKLDSQDDATRQACTHVLKSALRQYQYNLRKTHFEGKANSELAQTSPVENISDEDWRDFVKQWSDPKYHIRYMYVIKSHVELLFTHVPHKSIFL